MKDPLEEPKKLVDARARYFLAKERADALRSQTTAAENEKREAYKQWEALAMQFAREADAERWSATGDRPALPEKKL